jgi:hypothetical protein
MPVEIRELVIKSTINENKEVNDDPNVNHSVNADKLKKQIIEECVEVIMEKLERKARR